MTSASRLGVWSAPPVAWTMSALITSMSFWWLQWMQEHPLAPGLPQSASESPTPMTRHLSFHRTCKNYRDSSTLCGSFHFLSPFELLIQLCLIMNISCELSLSLFSASPLSLSGSLAHRVNLLIKFVFNSESIFNPTVLFHLFSLHLHLSSCSTVSFTLLFLLLFY